MPTTTSQIRPRLLTPDVARGLTLLGIAVANVNTAWNAVGDVPGNMYGGVVDNSSADFIAVLLGSIFVHVRGVAMFSMMLGYGVGMLCDSLQRRHYPVGAARTVLLWRYGLLAIFGVVHCILIFFGDIMFFYGIAGMLLATLITVKNKILWWIAGTMFALNGMFTILMAGISSFDLGSQPPTNEPLSYFDQLMVGLFAIIGSPMILPIELLMLFPLMIVGMIAARYRILDNPAAWKKLLVPIAVGGGVLMVSLGTAMALSSTAKVAWNPMVVWSINQYLGLLTGPAIIAMIALAMIPLQNKVNAAALRGETLPTPLFVSMLVALGKRSMSGYVAQSFLFTALVAPYGLYLAVRDGAWESSLIGILVWFITLVSAYVLERLSKPGPFEWLHRRLAYGKDGLAKDYFARQVERGLSIPMDQAHRLGHVDAQGVPQVNVDVLVGHSAPASMQASPTPPIVPHGGQHSMAHAAQMQTDSQSQRPVKAAGHSGSGHPVAAQPQQNPAPSGRFAGALASQGGGIPQGPAGSQGTAGPQGTAGSQGAGRQSDALAQTTQQPVSWLDQARQGGQSLTAANRTPAGAQPPAGASVPGVGPAQPGAPRQVVRSPHGPEAGLPVPRGPQPNRSPRAAMPKPASPTSGAPRAGSPTPGAPTASPTGNGVPRPGIAQRGTSPTQPRPQQRPGRPSQVGQPRPAPEPSDRTQQFPPRNSVPSTAPEQQTPPRTSPPVPPVQADNAHGAQRPARRAPHENTGRE